VLRSSLSDDYSYKLQCNPPSFLPALAYADDIALLCHTPEAAQLQLNRVHQTAELIGLRISASKTEVLHIGIPDPPNISLPTGETLKVCSDFRYLGISVFHPDSVFTERCSQAWAACSSLAPIFNADTTDDIKLRLFKAIVEPILCYGLECVPITAERGKRMDAAHRRMLRFSLNIHYPETISNVALAERTKLPSLTVLLRKQRLRLLGHCLRNDVSACATLSPRLPISLVFTTTPNEKFRRGMGRYITRRHQWREDLKFVGFTANEIGTMKKETFDQHVRSL
jgi:hypothetical protein